MKKIIVTLILFSNIVLTSNPVVAQLSAAQSILPSIYLLLFEESPFIVTNLNDSGVGSLRAAVLSANANLNAPVVDQIVFGSSLTGQTISLTTNPLNITEAVTINGPTSMADGIIISGNDTQQIFVIAATANEANFNNLTLMRGLGTDGGALANQNTGTTTLNNVVVSNSRATSSAGGILHAAGTMIINDSRIVGNRANFGGGLSISSSSANLTINRSTIDENRAENNGAGAGLINRGGTMTINSSTISHNISGVQGSTVGGGGIFAEAGTLNLNNTTVAHNISVGGSGGIDVISGITTLTSTTMANNVATVTTNAGGIRQFGGTVNLNQTVVAQNLNIANTTNNNQVGTFNSTESVSTNLLVLGPLLDNGGSTETMLPLVGPPVNPLIDAAPGTALPTDQRGFNRSVDGDGNSTAIADIGAAELNPTD